MHRFYTFYSIFFVAAGLDMIFRRITLINIEFTHRLKAKASEPLFRSCSIASIWLNEKCFCCVGYADTIAVQLFSFATWLSPVITSCTVLEKFNGDLIKYWDFKRRFKRHVEDVYLNYVDIVCLFHIYPSFTRKRIVSLYFWTACPHSLGSCHF